MDEICKFTTRFRLGKAFPNVFLGGEGKLKNSLGHKENNLNSKLTGDLSVSLIMY